MLLPYFRPFNTACTLTGNNSTIGAPSALASSISSLSQTHRVPSQKYVQTSPLVTCSYKAFYESCLKYHLLTSA